MKLSRLAAAGAPSLTATDDFPAAAAAHATGSATTSAAAEALAAAAAATTTGETDFAPSGGGGSHHHNHNHQQHSSRFLDTRREKNRLAAKRCRDRKQAHLAALESELAQQHKANDALSRHVVTLVGLYQQERKQKLAATTLLQALSATLYLPGCGPDEPPPTAPSAADGSAASPRGAPLPPPAMPLSLLPLLGGGGRSLSEVLTDLESGLLRAEDLEVYLRELRLLRLQVLPHLAPVVAGAGLGPGGAGVEPADEPPAAGTGRLGGKPNAGMGAPLAAKPPPLLHGEAGQGGGGGSG